MDHLVRVVRLLVVGLWVSAAPVSAAIAMPPGGPVSWIIESATYSGEASNPIARFEARYTIRVMQDGWIEVPLAIEGATITGIKIEKKSSEAYIVPRGTAYVFTTTKKGTYIVRVHSSTLLTQDNQFEGVSFSIPQATFSTLTLSVSRNDVELRPGDQLYVESQPDPQHRGVKLIARLGASGRVDLRWRAKPAVPVKVEPVLYGEVHTLVTLEEQLAHMMSIIEYRITQGETRELQVRVPTGVNILNVRGASIEDWRVSEASNQKMLTVILGFPLKETTYRLVVEGEQTFDEKQTAYDLPELELKNTKQERGYLAVSRTGSLELSPHGMEGINRVDVKELPDQLKAVIGSPAVLAFKYHQHPYHATLALVHHEDHPVLAAIAERGELVTVLSQQGALLTRATYLIKANKKQFLTVALPDGAQLWSCIVEGRSVKPVEGSEERLLIPLDTTTDTPEAVAVEMVYFQQRPVLRYLGHLMLQGPTLDVPTTIANWSVYAPPEIQFLRVEGNLERGMAQADFVDDPFAPMVFAQTGGRGGMFGDRIHRLNSKDNSRSSGTELLARQFKARRDAAVSESGVDEPVSDMAQTDPRDTDDKWTKAGAPAERQAFAAKTPQPTTPMNAEERFEDVVADLNGRLQEAGILPLKIRLPKSGTVYHFSRLMTTQEALQLDATFLHLHMPWLPFAAMGLLVVPLGGVALIRIRRR